MLTKTARNAKPRSPRWLLAAAGTATAAVLSGCAVPVDDAASEVPVETDTSTATEASAPDAAPEPPPAPEPNADGTFTSSCDYVLGDFTSNTESGYRFLADAQLDNTGNIGTVTKVKAVWYLSGGDSVKQTKKVRMKPNTSKRVGFTVPVSQDQLDRHQSLGFDAETCKVDATMVDTFGEPQ